MARQEREPIRVRSSVGLYMDQHTALVFMADDEGHGQPSRTVQVLVEKEIERRLGPTWRNQIREWAQQREAIAV